MHKLAPNKDLAAVLEKYISNYKFPGTMCGIPNLNPKISEDDLKKITVDIPHAKDMWCYVIPNIRASEQLAERIASMVYPEKKLINLSGRFHYFQKNFMGWHTNSNQEGFRLYATFCEEDKKSFFRYQENGKVMTEMEDKGWNFRGFEVRKHNPYWHCVYSDCNRYSFGFRFAK